MLGAKPFKADAGLPDEKQTELMTIQSVCAEHPFPVEQAENAFCPENVYDVLEAKWSGMAKGDFKGLKVRRLKEGWEIRHHLHESIHGEIELFCRWTGMEAVFGCYIFPYADDAEDDAGRDVSEGAEFLGNQDPKLLLEQKHFLEHVWLEAPRTTTIKRRGRQSRPNDRCDCGSGRKWKRCCGRKIR